MFSVSVISVISIYTMLLWYRFMIKYIMDLRYHLFKHMCVIAILCIKGPISWQDLYSIITLLSAQNYETTPNLFSALFLFADPAKKSS